MKSEDLKKYPNNNPLEFAECETCSARAELPVLCASCYHNRTVIDRQAAIIGRLEKRISIAQLVLEGE